MQLAQFFLAVFFFHSKSLKGHQEKLMPSLEGVWGNTSKMFTYCGFYITHHNVSEYLIEGEQEK